MTFQINIGDHASPNAGFIAFPDSRRGTMRWARQRALWIARNIPSADVYFRGITSGARSLTALLADSSIWVNYHATLTDFGVTPGSSGFATECAIGPAAFRIGRWTVLATLIHELAHCNGAPGGSSTAAEDALPHCGLGRLSEFRTGVDDPRTPYTPGLGG
ncbi:MAG: hypothetical protein M0R33_13300 [Methylomonas sp.]|jgi:hypothetical protein|uniref:hypothetical protein n=1 Tax=Methylomonas sp. TaxID=418 RepID=UPI0025E82FC0|nr:hypothetical protein [Methylomonas sp.]MCK9607410.1 hypothetical protein [Methylomonas sp.]